MRERLKSVPQKPGVYLFKDEQGKVVYVGKAKALRNRMRSYFQSPSHLLPKVKAMMARVRDFDYIITGNEVEALILECNLIKAYQPRYNVLLRDDKSYPYLKITLGEEYPRLVITREKKDNISRYFGPYGDVAALKETVRLLTGIFPVRTCREMKRGQRPCLNRDINRCLAPCTGEVDPEEYRQMVDTIIRFLEGDHVRLVRELEQEMKEASQDLEFEKAARLRDTVQAIQRVAEKQKVVLDAPLELDIIASTPLDREVLALVFKVRAGRVIAKDTFWLRAAMDEELPELLGSFLKQYYSENPDVPREILVPVEPGEKDILEAWLTEKNKAKTIIRVPHRGQKRQLLTMAEENARLLGEERRQARELGRDTLQEMARILSLEIVPERIECYDISHLSGEGTVGAMVVFTEGKKDSSAYRRFKLEEDMNDDYRAMEEVLRRRFTQARQENPSFLPWPDLVIVDGGLGQANTAYRILKEMGVDTPVFGLAKKNEELFRPGQGQPIRIPRTSEVLHLLQHIRDEAHRFAVSYQRNRRGKKLQQSELDEITGIGDKRKRALLTHFGSVARIREASLDELCQVKGMNRAAGLEVYSFFHSPKLQNCKPDPLIKLVAIDLDDTLLDSRLEIAEECREAILKVREKGVKVTLATGRMFRSALPYACQLNMNVPLITYQGAWVKNALSGETLYYRPVPLEYGMPLLQRVREFGYHYQTYVNDQLYMEELTPEGRAYAEMAGVTPVIVDRLEEVMTEDPLKILVVNYDIDRLTQLEQLLKAEFGQHLYITRSKPYYLEAMHPEATKAKALEAVAGYFGIAREEVMAIGDSYNDLDMVRWAGLGIAVANARDVVRREADYVTSSNEEHGVAEALIKFILKREEN